MNKEPLVLYIFRFLIGLGILIFLVMLYWSSALVEEDLLALRADVSSLKNEITNLNEDFYKIAGNRHAEPQENDQRQSSTSSSITERPHIDTSIPNLLEEDPYYKTTLPKLLGANFKPHGMLTTASVGKYDNLLPFADWYEVGVWNGFCISSVSKQLFGKFETYSPDLAIKLEERKNKDGHPEYWIHLRDNVFWKPLKKSFFPEGFELAEQFLRKQQVTAEDFKFYFDAVMNPYISAIGAVSLKPYLQDIVEFRVIDKLTFVVRWKEKTFTQPDGTTVSKTKYIAKGMTASLRPLPSFVYKYYSNGKKIIESDEDLDTYRTNAIWAQGFSQHWARNVIVSCGPLVFDGRTERQINFQRNRDYYFPLETLVEKREVLFKENADNAWQDFKGNKLSYYSIQPDQLLELQNFLKSDRYLSQSEKNQKVERLDYLSRAFNYIGWNEKTPYFNTNKVRQALTMAIDRKRIIQQFIHNMGQELTGPMFPLDKSYDKSIQPFPYDLQKAKRLLEEEGWYDHNGDGIIDKTIDGQQVPFRFVLNYLTRSNLAKGIAEFVATSLKEVGIDCRLNGLDYSDMTAKINDKNFDAIMLAWALGSPPDELRQLWYTDKGDEKGSSNYIGFSNAEVDEIINDLEYESDSEKRIALYHRFHKIIHEEAPYVFLYCPKVSLLSRENVRNVWIPSERQDLIPGADISEPETTNFWIKP